MTATVEAARPVTRRSLDLPVQVALAAATVALVFFPLVPILVQAFSTRPLYDPVRAFTLSNFTRVLSSGAFWSVVGTTVAFAALTTVLAVTLGTVLAILVERTDLPARGLLNSLVILPFYVSPLVLAFAWAVIYGPQGYLTIRARQLIGHDPWNLYSIPGLAVVSMVYYVPYTYLYCTAALSLSDPQVEDAARIAGAGPLRAIRAVTLPLLRPAITYSALLTFVSALELLSIPLVLGTPAGIRVLASYLYILGIAGGRIDYGAIAAISVLTVAIVTALVWVQERLVSEERRFVTTGGRASRIRPMELGSLRWLAFVFVMAYFTFAVLLPLIGIVAQSATAFLSPLINPLQVLTWENYRLILETEAYRRSIVNSLIIATLGGAIGILFMAFISLMSYRSEFPGRRALTYLALYPRAIPGIIVGIGFLWAFLLIPGLGAVRNTIWALMAAFIMRYIPLGFGAVSPAILRISPELDRAARVAGADWLGTTRRILLPLVRPALLSGYILLVITFLKEYSSALFLFARGSEVIGTTMIELWRQGNSGPVAALASIQIVLTLIVLAASSALLRRR
uniref:Iron ABC transporter permease n=2 Tax=Thermorudis TaxID=1649508 RepID=A0A831X084_9BACT